MDDLRKHYQNSMIGRMHKSFTGQIMHPRPRVRETLMIAELLFSG